MRVLTPLVRFMLTHGFTYREFAELSKTVFFDSGRQILAGQKKNQTASHLSLLTGLHRKDIAVFLQTPPDETADESLPASVALVTEWISNKDYLGPDGHPRPLKYAGEFAALAQRVSKDVRPKTYLDELIRLEIASLDAQEMVSLKKEAFIPSTDMEEKLKYFARNAGTHIAASLENVASDHPRHFDRSAQHSKLTPDDIERLRAAIDADGMAFLKNIYKQAQDLSQASDRPPDAAAGKRITIGVYAYDEETSDETH